MTLLDGILSSTGKASGQVSDLSTSIHEGGGSAGGMGSDWQQEFHHRFSDLGN